MRVALVGCVKSKLANAAPAREFYNSALFRYAVQYAEANADKWYVLSAKHGLIPPSEIVTPYDETLKSASRAQQRAWAERVQKQLVKAIPRGAEVIVLAGDSYRRDLVPFLQNRRGCKVNVPLQGKRFGEQLQALASAAELRRAQLASSDLDRFYTAMRKLSSLPGQGLALGECHGRMNWPDRGVYFFVEPGEVRRDAKEEPRVVRVGTHAVSTGARSTLWPRLRAHRGTSSSGTGNHRGSVFRRHVGQAILSRGASTRSKVPTWGVGSNAPRPVRMREAALESDVTAYMAATRVFWVDVPDAAGPESMRAYIERNAVALLANKLNPRDRPSKSWLGRWSDREEIRRSGLWNVDFVRENYDPRFLHSFEGCVERMAKAPSLGTRSKP